MRNQMTLTAAILLAAGVVFGWLSAPACPAQSASLSAEEAVEIAEEAYIYAYPLVLMDVTRQQLTNYAEPTGVLGQGPPNRFYHLREFPDPKFKIVIRPNVDTLYSNAWLDLAAEPVVLSVPKTDRYFMLPMLCMWTDVFDCPGTRTTGKNQAGDFAVVGPNYRGDMPQGMQVIKSPTRYVWIIGRTQTNGKTDYENVWKIQDGYKLTPLSAWGKKDYVPAPGKVNPAVDMKTPPPVQVEKMDAAQFFGRFAQVLKDNPSLFYDEPLVHQIRRLGFEPGRDFDFESQPPAIQEALQRAVKEGYQKLAAAAKKASGAGATGWALPAAGGFYGNDYLARAAVANYGLGMNLTQDAVYPSLATDSNGDPLDGRNKYVLRFEKGQTPPVKAFWSVTVYDQEGYMFPNPLGRNALGDRDKLQVNDEGSLDLYLQAEAPSKNKEANWLPMPKGQFNLLLRLYWPSEAILDGSWKPPLAKRVD